MPLQDVVFTTDDTPLPIEVDELIRVAQTRAEHFARNADCQSSGFVPSDPAPLFRTMSALLQNGMLTGKSFCEWGSGFGTATCLAASLGLEAIGIELDESLIDNARKLATEFALPATFVQGSYVPSRRRAIAEEAFEDTIGRYPWLKNDADDAYQKLRRGLDSFDIVFAYPWPGEEFFINQLFDADGAPGALLLIYTDSSITVRRKYTNKEAANSKQRMSA